jgi:hypothetical protein
MRGRANSLLGTDLGGDGFKGSLGAGKRYLDLSVVVQVAATV